MYGAHFAFVWRSARRLGVAEGSLDDVAQETFIVVHRQLAHFERRSSLKTWLFGIVVNIVRAHRRSMRARPTQPLADGTTGAAEIRDAAPQPHDVAARAEAARLVERILDALDEGKREVFVLAELEQMTAPDIAAALGLPVNSVYSRLRLARQEFAAAAARHRAKDERRIR
ncbi:MAG: RNA polymerase sigma factor [Polyangiaceae bacterium]